MRRVASLTGVALSACALVLFVVTGFDNVWAYVLIAALAAVGLADAYVITRHMHSGHGGRP